MSNDTGHVGLLRNKKIVVILWLSLVMFFTVVLGAYVLGTSVYRGLTNSKQVIAVNGRADKNISATAASIQIKITCTGDDIDIVKKKLDDVYQGVNSYINKEAVSGTNPVGHVEDSDITLTDKKTNQEVTYENGQEVIKKIERYSAERSISLYDVDVKNMKKLKNKIDFDFVSNGYSAFVSVDMKYTYPDVNTIKPELLKESLDNARMAAKQFAKDSGQKIGSIQTASQGIVMLEEHDEYEIASIVSTVTFYLK